MPEDEWRMEMANNRALDLGKFGAEGVHLIEKRQRGRVMAEEQDALIGFELGEGLPD